MSEPDCPNIAGCRLVNDPGLHIENNNRETYIESYYRGVSRATLIIMPDSKLTLDEIPDRIEKES